MRVAIYIRESTNFQNPEAQLAECLEYCKENNWEVVATYQDIASGAKANRKQFLQMQSDIEENLFDGIVLWELSRSTRDFITYKMMINRMFELGKELYSLQEGRLTEDDIDTEFSTDIRAMLNAYERKRIGRRVKFRKDFTRKQGLWTGGTTPFGYKLIKGQLAIDEDTAPIVIDIFEKYCNGFTPPKIAEIYGFEVRKVRRMLQNPVYIGYLRDKYTEMIRDKRIVHKDFKLIKGVHQAIVSEEMFQKAAIVQKTRKRVLRKTGTYLLSSVYDFHGIKMYPSSNYRQDYYANCRKGTKYYNKDELEREVIEELINEIEKMCFLNTIEKETNEETKVSKKEHLTKELQKNKEKFDKLLKQYLNGVVSEEIFENISSEIKKEEKELQEELKKINNNPRKHKKILKEENVELLKKYLEKLKTTQDRVKLREILDLIIYEVRMVNDFRFYIVTNLY